MPHPHTKTALANASASGLPADSIVKAVVLKGADGFMLALLPASRHIQFDVHAVERAAATQDDAARGRNRNGSGVLKLRHHTRYRFDDVAPTIATLKSWAATTACTFCAIMKFELNGS